MRSFQWLAIGAAILLMNLSARADVTLEAEQTAYQEGELVIFLLHNDTAREVAWGSLNRYPTIWRREPDGAERIVVALPPVMDKALGLLPPGDFAGWQWDQRGYIPGKDDLPPDNEKPGGGPGGLPQDPPPPPGAPVRQPLRTVAPVAHKGVQVSLGRYFALFETLDRLIQSPAFRVGGSLPVQPKGKLTTTWAALKGR